MSEQFWQTALTLVASLCLPVLGAALAGALVAAVLKAAIQLDDSVVNLAFKLAAIGLLFYYNASFFTNAIGEFTEKIWAAEETYR